MEIPKKQMWPAPRRPDRFAYFHSPLLIILALGFLSCGGGTLTPQSSPSPGPSPGQPPSECKVFPIWVMPDQVEIAQESSETIAIGINGYVGVAGAKCSGFFTSPATIQVSGLPAGVTVSPGSVVDTPQGPPQPLTISVSTSATPANTTLTLTGTSSTMTATLSLPFYIMPANPLTSTPTCPSSTPPPAPNPSPHSNEWTWESGSNTLNQPSVYGTEGTPSASNVPGARVAPASWTDSSGNLWLFGGYGVESSIADHNDLWKYTAGEWTWVGGSNLTDQPGVYGTLGVPAAGNVPGTRDHAASWTDASGNFWLFGGMGPDSTGTRGILNDLWKYEPATGMWTWMGGPSIVCDIEGNYYCTGVYGTQGVPSPGNAPGSQDGASSWTDSCGNLWLFGTSGNDLWRYEPATNMWTWMSGANITTGQNGTYGTLGVPDPGNVPGARVAAASWTDKSGNLWLFGGNGQDVNGLLCEETAGPCELNDLWKYDPTTNIWTWMGGSNIVEQPGVYGTQGTPTPGNMPGGRDSAVAWTDAQGNFWLFGGTGYDSHTNPKVFGDLNDLWMYDPATGMWTWMSGSNTAEQFGTYGTLGTAAPDNVPGARGMATGWADPSGNLWLFGGFCNFGNPCGKFNDLWKYQP